jgi:hypothetical protein
MHAADGQSELYFVPSLYVPQPGFGGMRGERRITLLYRLTYEVIGHVQHPRPALWLEPTLFFSTSALLKWK